MFLLSCRGVLISPRCFERAVQLDSAAIVEISLLLDPIRYKILVYKARLK
jgi:hypothetical protein